MADFILVGRWDAEEHYTSALNRIAEATGSGFHMTTLLVPRRGRGIGIAKEELAEACNCPIFDYVYGTLWKCRWCTYTEHRTPEA